MNLPVSEVIGVSICTVKDVKVNAKGFLCACVDILSTYLQQIVSDSQLVSSVIIFIIRAIQCCSCF